MNIREASETCGLSEDTIRFYERAGMLPPLPRDSRGWRRFDPPALEWLKNLAHLRATGMPMAEMQRFALLVHARDAAASREERLAILERHNRRLACRRTELAEAQAYLDHKIAVYGGMK
jgi:DNA-binding transcriptional MerR regulator